VQVRLASTLANQIAAFLSFQPPQAALVLMTEEHMPGGGRRSLWHRQRHMFVTSELENMGFEGAQMMMGCRLIGPLQQSFMLRTPPFFSDQFKFIEFLNMCFGNNSSAACQSPHCAKMQKTRHRSTCSPMCIITCHG